MQIPVEVLFSPIKGGWFEWDAGGKLIARWRRTRDGRVVVEWQEEAKARVG